MPQAKKPRKATAASKTLPPSGAGAQRPRKSPLQFAAACCQGMGARSNQEDSFGTTNWQNLAFVRDYGLTAVLADGMGGMKDGKAASQLTVDLCLRSFSQCTANIRAALLQGVAEMNREVFTRFGGESGATLVVAKIVSNGLWWLCVGDSALYLKRGGALLRINKEHTHRNNLYLKELFSGGIVDKARADADEDARRLSEFVGAPSIDEIECNHTALPLREGDTLLLCSDGVNGYIPESAIDTALTFPPEQACGIIVNSIAAQGRADQDNYTAIVIRCMKTI